MTKLYMALFATSYYGLFRIGEVTVTESDHTVKACDVRIGTNKRKLLFVLRSSKTHSCSSEPQFIKIAATKSRMTRIPQTQTQFCPYAILRGYLGMSGDFQPNSESFFIFRDNQEVKAQNLHLTLKYMLSIAGFIPKHFSGHSFRAGRAVDLLKYGLSAETIRKLGQWKSNSVYKYLK